MNSLREAVRLYFEPITRLNRPLVWRWGLAWRPVSFGWGFGIERDRPRYFSERYGYRRVYRLGRWSLTLFERSS